jgi:hypothetical protein
MRLIEEVTEHEMAALFLKSEFPSPRYRDTLLSLLQQEGLDPRIIEEPNATDEAENRIRLKLLGDFRGFRQNRSLFEGFPEDVSWYRYALTREELARVHYIDYSYWNELSSGSRLPTDAAQNIRAGVEIFEVSNEGFLRMADAFRQGACFPELILVGTEPGFPLVALEGHARLTTYFLAPECLPETMTALVGFSSDMATWMALPALPERNPS